MLFLIPVVYIKKACLCNLIYLTLFTVQLHLNIQGCVFHDVDSLTLAETLRMN